MIAVQDPEDVKAILQTSRELYPKDDWSYTFFKYVRLLLPAQPCRRLQAR